MSKVVCSQCGAPVTSNSKFCSHCGAKIPDDVFRAEIRIDNTAEIQRAQYETEESKFRQKQMKSDMIKNRIVWILIGLIAFIGIVLFSMVFFDRDGMRMGAWMFFGIMFIILAIYLALKHAMKK